jgi:hypothetical protein
LNTGVIFEGNMIPKNKGDGDDPNSSYFNIKPNTPLHGCRLACCRIAPTWLQARVLPNREMVPTVPSPHRPQPQASSTVARIRRPRAGGTEATSTTRSGLREASTSPDHHTRGAGPMRMRCGGDEYDRTGGGRGRQRQPADRPTDPGTWTW